MTSRYVEELAAELLMIGFPGKTVCDQVERMMERGVRSFALFARNSGNQTEVQSLTRQLRRLAGSGTIVAVDEEGGSVSRLHRTATRWPSAMACAATHNLDLVERAAAAAAAELGALGINLNFAPVADVMTYFRNPVLSTRVFSDDPETTARFVAAVIRGHRRAGIGSTAKHFPGHGATPTDSHLDLPTVDRTLEELREIDLIPFVAAVQEGVECMMISHVWYARFDATPTPAAVSRNVVELARQELGFDGVILSDCLEMAAIQDRMSTRAAVAGAVAAGCDIPIVSHRLDRQEEGMDGLIDATERGEVPLSRVEDAAQRVRRLRARLTEHPGSAPRHDLAAEVARQAATLVRDRDRFLPLRLTPEEKLAIISFPTRAMGAEGTPVLESVPALARRYHANLTHLVVSEEAGADGRGDIQTGSPDVAVRCAENAAATVVLTAFSTGRPVQAETVAQIAALKKPLVVVAARDPYDLLCFPRIPCYVAIYGENEPSLDAGFALIFGRQSPSGRLPVALPGLYPRGYGITRHRG